jgi:3-oxoacyl-[acyl-carrier protein] reductase
MLQVTGKWALITGASRGIGHQIAMFMAEKGCNLVLHSRNTDNTKELLRKVQDMGVDAYSVSAELSDIDDVNKMLDEIENKGTHIDILFNDAAIQVAYRSDFWNTPVEDFRACFNVNTIAPAIICYRLIPKMIKRGFGRIINTTSGIKNEPAQAAYSTSKAALDKFTTDLATVVDGTDVILSLMDPGWCRTDLGGSQAPNSVESSIPGVVVGAFLDDRKSGRFISAQDYAGLSIEEAVRKASKLY